MQCDDISKAILDAWHRVSYGISDAELDTAKNRLITKLLNEQSSKLHLLLVPILNFLFVYPIIYINIHYFIISKGTKGNCEDIGRSVLALNRRVPLNELINSIEGYSNQAVRDVTDKYVNNKCPVLSAVGPIENLTDYVNLRTRMYWARV